MKGMTAQETIMRLELDADMKMKGLKIVDYEQYQRYEYKKITWVTAAVALTLILGFALGLGASIARSIFG
jgi:hypothetical protein